jgi:hypothetical protein
MNIVVLGDCASNGNNCFAHRIIDNPQRITYSLAYNEYQDGEDSELKLKAQQILSDRINTHLTLSK